MPNCVCLFPVYLTSCKCGSGNELQSQLHPRLCICDLKCNKCKGDLPVPPVPVLEVGTSSVKHKHKHIKEKIDKIRESIKSSHCSTANITGANTSSPRKALPPLPRISNTDVTDVEDLQHDLNILRIMNHILEDGTGDLDLEPEPGPLESEHNNNFPDLYFQEEYTSVYTEINRYQDTSVSLHDRIIQKKGMPVYAKAIAIMKLKHAGPESTIEYSNAIKWIESLLKVPFGQYTKTHLEANVEAEGGIEAETDSKSISLMEHCKEKFDLFDTEVYGMNQIKEEIISYLVDFITSPSNRKPILGLCGNPGVGKTKILKMFSSIIGLPAETLKFGGKKNPEQFEGQDSVYVSSSYGDITAILIKTQCMNPIIILEEIDKISQQHSAEIYGVLTHLLDPEQNNEFKDKYFSEISMDLSKVIFAVTYNDKSMVSPIVLDRIKEIVIKDKTVDEKVNIVRDYLLPTILSKYSISKDQILFDSDDTIRYIIRSKTPSQGGVRKLSDNIYEIVRKINTLLKLYNNGGGSSTTTAKSQGNILNLSFYIPEIVERVSATAPDSATTTPTTQPHHTNHPFPIVITRGIVDILLAKEESLEIYHSMYT